MFNITCTVIGQKEGESHDQLCSNALKKLKEASPLSLKITLQSVSAVFYIFLIIGTLILELIIC